MDKKMLQAKNKWIKFFFLLSPFWFTLITYAKTITCAPPEGTRIDYFAYNSLNLENQKFFMGRDRVSTLQPKIILDNNNKNFVTFVLGTDPSLTNTMKVLQSDSEQISFAGLINGAPMLASYYLKLQILIYSQQSIWPGPNFQGARASIFYSKCTTSNQ